MSKPLTIGVLSRESGVNLETIRFYEREGLLPAAPRTEGNYRIYTPEHAERLGFIRQCRNLDMTLDEVRSLLQFRDAPEQNCGAVNSLLDKHIGHVAQRIRELRALEKQLKALRAQCIGVLDTAHCGILEGLAVQSAGAPPSGHLHGTHRKVPARSEG